MEGASAPETMSSSLSSSSSSSSLPSSSLERFKTLDALHSVDQQLEVASTLCNHRARAEMMLRWLLAKMKASEEMRQKAASWRILDPCVRLLTPHRWANLLTLSGFIDVLRLTCQAPHLLEDCLLAVAHFWHLLTVLGRASGGGGTVQAVISVQSGLAAGIARAWLQHVYRLGQSDVGGVSMFVAQHPKILEPALDIWAFRKRDALTDHALFNIECLVPASLLLAVWAEDGATSSAKRKRRQPAPASASSCKRSLEYLIAKHTILPARASFLRKQDGQSRRLPRDDSKASQPDVATALTSLKNTVSDATMSPQIFGAVASVWDVGLRAVATPTPKHRFKERPWVEAMFLALYECVEDESSAVLHNTIVSMLQLLRRNAASLSTETLVKLLRRHALPQASSSQACEWKIIAEVATLDAATFADLSLTQEIFDHITTAQQESGVDDLVKDGVLIPILKAYAQNRSLTLFMECWLKQLLREKDDQWSSVWVDLVSPFADLMESSLSQDQILAAWNTYSVSASDLSVSTGNADERITVCAKVVLLRALISGVRSESLAAKLHGKMDELRMSFFSVKGIAIERDVTRFRYCVWDLITSLFVRWFPAWAADQNEATITVIGVSAMTSEYFQDALAQAQRISRATSSAQMLVGTICSYFIRYNSHEQCNNLCATAVETLCEQPSTGLRVLLKYRGLPDRLTPERSKALYRSAFIDSSSSTGEETLKVLPALPAKIQQMVIEEAVRIGTAKRKPKHDESDILLPVLSSVDKAVLTSQQCADIVNALLTMKKTPATIPQGAREFESVLSVTMEAMAQPHSSAQLLNDPVLLSKLLSLFETTRLPSKKANSQSAVTSDSYEVLQLLREATRNIVGYWSTLQDHARRRELLMMTSKLTASWMKQLADDECLSSRDAVLAMASSALSILENVRDGDTIMQFSHRDKKFLRAYVHTLIADSNGSKQENEAIIRLAALDALLVLPDSIWDALGSQRDPFRTQVVQLAGTSIRDVQASNYIIASCFQVMSRYDSASDLESLAEDVLSRDLEATQHAAVVEAYRQKLNKADSSSVVAIFERSLRKENPRSLSSVVLLWPAIKAIGKAEVESAASFSVYDIYHHVLHIASGSGDIHVRRLALQLISMVLKEKSFMINQHSIEQTILLIQQLGTRERSMEIVFGDTCHVLRLLLTQYRARLEGRFHMVVALFQTLISSVLRHSTILALQARQARSLARVLQLFCHPPHTRSRGKASQLVDESRRAQAQVGQYVHYILHHFCSQVLIRAPAEGVREALTPGLWAIIEAIEVNNPDGIKSLSAAMNNSERAVLRTVYDDWKRFGKWEGL